MENSMVTLHVDRLAGVGSFRPVGLRVCLEGQPQGRLAVTRIVHESGAAGLRVYLLALELTDPPALVRGQRIAIWGGGIPGDSSGQGRVWCLFDGVIEACEAGSGKSGPTVEAVASESFAQAGRIVAGKWTLESNGSAREVRCDTIIFNSDGAPNASRVRVPMNGRTAPVFESRPGGAVFWTAASAIEYLLATGDCRIVTSGLEAFSDDSCCLNDLDVSHLTVAQALERIAGQVGGGWVLDCVACQGQWRPVIRFYRRGAGRLVSLPSHPARGRLDIRKLGATQFRYTPAHPVAPVCIKARGGLKRYEATFELQPGWDRALESSDYDRYSPGANPQFVSVRDVYRKWVLNETGWYGGVRTDLTALFEGEPYELRARRFWPCISRFDGAPDDPTLKGGYFVEVSYNGGASWLPYEGACHVLTGECGLYLSPSQLDAALWIAICKEALRLRITAALDGDTPLEVSARTPGAAGLPVRQIIIDGGDRYRYGKVSPASRFYRGPHSPGGQDDSAALRMLANRRLHEMAGSKSARLTLPWPRWDIRPGDCILLGANPIGQVNRVELHFDPPGHTELWLE